MNFSDFTHAFKAAMSEAQMLAVRSKHATIEPIHVLKALLAQPQGNIPLLFEKASVHIKTLEEKLNEALKNLPVLSHANAGDISVSKNLVNLLYTSDQIAKQQKDTYLSSGTFVLAAINDSHTIGKLLRQAGLSENTFKHLLHDWRSGESINDPDAENRYQELDQALQKYTTDLTERASQGKLDPVIGRDDTIRRLIQVLQRRTKNNPVLIGPAGVGKTAIVEGLAQRILNKEVPETMQSKRLLVLDMADIIAGAKYRGEFEERLKSVLKVIQKQPEQFILFVDELHTLIGTGKSEGAIDAGNMLKPALAKGELHCIGATTLDEYREYIEKDPALERRFQRILVDEPDEETTIAMLQGLKQKYELHHGVRMTYGAVVAAARYAHRYLSDRFLPDSAIDLMDEALSRESIARNSRPEALDILVRQLTGKRVEIEALKKETDRASKLRLEKLTQEVDTLKIQHENLENIWDQEKASLQNEHNIKSALEKAQFELETATRESDFARMSELTYGNIPNLEKELEKLQQQESSKNTNRLIHNEVTEQEIANVISQWTGIPLSKLTSDEQEKLLHIEDALRKQVVAQEDALKIVANAIRRGRAGLSDPNKPIGSFIFAGPTGVGKTALCKTLATFLFDSEHAMIRLDMSEYMEKHSISELIGSPKGYQDSEKGGSLTEAVRRRPYSLILLDEVEKAHPDVLNTFLQVLDEGRLTDRRGHTVDFRNTIIVMTSNLGSDVVQDLTDQEDYFTLKLTLTEIIGKHFRPEFVNRIDEIVVFHSLNQDALKQITNLQIEILRKRLEAQEIGLTISDASVNYLSQKGFDPVYGARPLKRTMQNLLENPIAQGILDKKYPPQSVIHIEYQNNQLLIHSSST